MSRAGLFEAEVPLPDAVGGVVVQRSFTVVNRQLHRGEEVSPEVLLSWRNWEALVRNRYVEVYARPSWPAVKPQRAQK